LGAFAAGHNEQIPKGGLLDNRMDAAAD
jgi:hypothetical protein